MSNELPGQRALDAGFTPREILMSDEAKVVRVGPCVIDSANAIDGGNTGRTDELRAGTLMAKITATGKWVPHKRTTVLSGGGAGVTTVVLTNATLFRVGDTITIGGDAVTITAIDYTTGAITWAGAATVANAEAVIGASGLAGSETARAILKGTVRLLSGEPFQTNLLDKSCVLLIGGYVNAAMIIGDLTAARADTGSKLGGFIWSDEN